MILSTTFPFTTWLKPSTKTALPSLSFFSCLVHPHITLFAFCFVRWFSPFVSRDSAWVFVYTRHTNLLGEITVLVPLRDGPLQPVPCALILLGNHFSSAASNLVNSFQPQLTQGRGMFPPRAGQHLLQSSIIVWQLISSTNTLHPTSVPTVTACSISSKNATFFNCLLTALLVIKEPVANWIIRLCTEGRDYSLVVQGDLLFLMAPVHLACPGIQKKEKKKTQWVNWWGGTAREMTWVPLYVHIYLSAWHCAASVFCWSQTALQVIENDSPSLLLVQ